MRRFWPLILFVLIFSIAMIGINDSSLPKKINNQTPQRIISLAPSITEILFALGLDSKVVGDTDYCDYPEKAKILPKVGGYINPNLEAIVALEPDLVVLLANQSQLIEQLKQLNLPTLAVKNTRLNDIQQAIKIIGDRTQHQAQAEQLLSHIKQQINTIKHKTASKPRPRVLITMGHSMDSNQIKTIYIAGQHDFYNDLITLAGGVNAYQKTNLKVPSLSIEGIVQLNPDIIIDIFPEADDHRINIKQAIQRWHKLDYINAVKNDRVYIVEQSYATIPGPRLFLLLQKMAQLIHPEIDWQQDAPNDNITEN